MIFDMEAFSVLFSICEGYRPLIGGFSSQYVSNTEHWCHLCCQIEQIVKEPVI